LTPQRCPDRDSWEALLKEVPSDLENWLSLDIGSSPWECKTAGGEPVAVGSLLPETPGAHTLDQSKDIARWREDVVQALSYEEATIAVISDNLWGTRVGAGYRQGARGEQFVMTLVEPTRIGASMWERVWLNVLPADAWRSRYGDDEIEFQFPWKQVLPTAPMTPENTHSLGILFQMPRRWGLIVDEDGLVRRAYRANHGRHYEGWEKLHPLTPYFAKSDGTWVACKVGAHTGLSDWASIALSYRASTQPAAVVHEFIQNSMLDEQLRLRCLGWALGDAGAAGAWVDHVVPFYRKNADQASQIDSAILSANKQKDRLKGALGALRRSLGTLSGGFMNRIEPTFFERARFDNWDGWERELKAVAREMYWQIAEDHRIDTMAAAKQSCRL
jgi:CRISPR type I-E-associated protein CasA/Cse1